jgi:hypothetical protein
MQEQVNSPRPSEVGKLEWLGTNVNTDDRTCPCEGRTLEGSLSWPRPRPRWAAAAGVLLLPERELTERGREVKERWQALIAEARDITELELAVGKAAGEPRSATWMRPHLGSAA